MTIRSNEAGGTDGEAPDPGSAPVRTAHARIAPVLASRRDRLKQLQAFCEAARKGSISGAAKAVGLSQPAVSLQVRALEEEFGVVLFERRGPRIALTPVGERLYESAMPVVQGVLRLPALFAEAHHGTPAQSLRIGAGQTSAAYLLPGPLKRFAERYPGMRIEVRTGTGPERLEWLRTFDLDAVVGVVDAAAPGVEFRPMRTTRMVLVTPLDHPLANRGAVAPAALARHRLVAPKSGRGARRLHDMLLHLHGVAPRVLVEVDGWGAIVNHVAGGAGIAFVPDMCVSACEPVATVAVKAPAVRRTYGTAVRSGGLMSQAARRFVEMLASEAPGAGDAQ